MSVTETMRDACAAVGISPPRYTQLGRWVGCPVTGKGQSNGSGRVLIFEDGQGGIAWNWVTGQQQRFKADGLAAPGEVRRPRRDPDAKRLAAERQQAAVKASQRMVETATADVHPYLEGKGFPQEVALVHENPIACLPRDKVFDGLRHKLWQMSKPFLIVPGRTFRSVATVQIIDVHGTKLNMKAAPMAGSAHRISTGRETWVCEGFATALTVRTALRRLNRSATVLSAFAANNVAKVAKRLRGAIIAADHDKPLEQLGNVGTGEFYAAATGCIWTMPPALGDFNDMHVSDGLRAVAMHLREVRPP